MRHRCNAFCRAEEHCDLVYAGPVAARTGSESAYQLSLERWTAEISESYRRHHGLSVTRVLPAQEASRQADHPSGALEQLIAATRGPSDQERWLVWWHLDPDALLSLAHTADYLGVSYQLVDRLVRQGRIPAQRIGGTRLVRGSDLIDFAAQERPPGRPKRPTRYPL